MPIGAYAHYIELVTSSGHTQLRSDQTLASPAPDVGGYPYYFVPICLSYRPGP